MLVRITRLREDIPLPAYKTDGSVAFDLAPCEKILIPSKANVFAKTGLIIATPPGYALLIAPRSSLFKNKGLRIGNTIGIVDQDFCGPKDELLLSFWNPGEHSAIVEKDERVAQGMFVKIDRAEWQEGAAEGPSRGGWGSTG
jgi:dUTP pyrophosphatase